MLFFLLIFIVVVSIQFLFNTSISEKDANIEQAKTPLTPEQMELQTMTSISDIVLNQFLENVILNIDLNAHEDKQDIILYLQANEFLSEDTLLKDSYNLLKEIQHVELVHDVTLKWHKLVKDQNTEILSLSFANETVINIDNYTYRDLKTLASQYKQHEALNK